MTESDPRKDNKTISQRLKIGSPFFRCVGVSKEFFENRRRDFADNILPAF